MTPSKILFFLCISFIAGIFLESLIIIPQIFLWAFLFVGFFLIFIFAFLKKPLFFGFCMFLFVLGILRVQISEFNIANDKLAQLNGKGQVTLSGIIYDEPDVRDTSQKLRVKVGDDIILVTAKRYPEYKYLDKIEITGKLEQPMVTDDFNYKNYLLKDNIYSVMNFAKIQLILSKPEYNFFSYFYSRILFTKERLSQSIQNNFLPPQGLILEGIILGDNKNMTQNLRDELNISGLRFLTAISGVHVIILGSLLMGLLLALGFWRNWAFYFSVSLIWLYVVLTGFTASGIRAAIMGSIFLLAEKLGRQNTSSRLIVLAAALMLLQNPLLLIYDVGFQLSFLASLGIIYFKPLMSLLMKKIFKEKFRGVSEILAVTLTAQIFTLPVMVFNFGNISFISPLTNLLILPVMPWILSFGFLFAISASISVILGWIFYIPCWILITYFIKIMEVFSQSWMGKSITGVSWAWLALYYFFIFTLILYLNKFKKPKFL